MTKSTTYRINVGTLQFKTHREARNFLEGTKLPGILKKTRGGKHSIQVGVFRTGVRKDALRMKELILEFSGRNVKIIPEYNDHGKTSGVRR